MGFPVSGCAGVWVCWYLRVVFLLTLVCLCLPAGLGCLPACPLRCLPALLAWVPAGLACLVLAGLVAWVPARHALNVSTTRGTVPLTLVTARHDWNPVAAAWPLFSIESSPSGRISNGRRPNKRKVESVSVWRRSDWNFALEVCVIGRSMNIRSAWAGLGLHLK